MHCYHEAPPRGARVCLRVPRRGPDLMETLET
jgi:hypothetical protein